MIEHSPDVQRAIESAIQEDMVYLDPTTTLLVPPDFQANGVIKAKSPGVLAGVGVGLQVFRRVDPELIGVALLEDGSTLERGSEALRVRGRVGSILRAERIALNFMQRMSGIATATRQYVKAVEGTKASLVDTRKTAPGLRVLDKYSVRMGGGRNHRGHLADGILIKENHIEALRMRGLSLREVVELALYQAPHTIKVEVEVETLEQVEEAMAGGAQIILLDNMSPDMMRRAVQLVNGRAMLEASGGITLENVRAVAETGVDIISVGALTHSVKALDLSLDITY